MMKNTCFHQNNLTLEYTNCTEEYEMDIRENAKGMHPGRWMDYALNDLDLLENEAMLIWNEENNLGKKCFCECRGDEDKPGSRMFMREVTDRFSDSSKKFGWWDTFTYSREKVEPGYYVCEIVRFRRDKNGYVNAEVKALKKIDSDVFDNVVDGLTCVPTNSAWWLLVIASRSFAWDYNNCTVSLNKAPNYDYLVEQHPEFSGVGVAKVGEIALQMWIDGKLDVVEIRRCLDMPTEFEELCMEVTNASMKGTVMELYGEKYPLFASKVGANTEKGIQLTVLNLVVYGDSVTSIHEKVKDYINRQLKYYNDLIANASIEPVSGSYLDRVEAALEYRKSLKDAEKAERKKKRKEKK